MKRFFFVGLALLYLGMVAASQSQQPSSTPIPSYGCVDINIANLNELKLIIHIDTVRGQEIIRLRETRRFAKVEDLTRVKGIGKARLKDIIEQGLACVRP